MILQIYLSARTAHLERAQASDQRIQLVYLQKCYDFEEDLRSLVGAERQNILQIMWTVFRSQSDVIELNEPYYVRAWPLILLSMFSNWLRGLIFKRKARIVCYAIENLPIDSWSYVDNRLLQFGEAKFKVVMSRTIFNLYDKIAFGTDGSLKNYARIITFDRDERHRVFDGLGEPCKACRLADKKDMVAFVGSFEKRKGIRRLMEAWPLVAAELPHAKLTVLGKGPLETEVKAWTSQAPNVELLVSPPRAMIHETLSKAKVLVLLSQPERRWKEQIGLPILEGLSHGCAIVASTETGIAAWLSAHGHRVVAPDAADAVVADTIVNSLVRFRGADPIVADLPRRDMRQEASSWLAR